MAVYTSLDAQQIKDFLKRKPLGEYLKHQGITQGIENTNYLLSTTSGQFILTLIEKRTDPQDLPFIFSFMNHLNKRGITVPGILAQDTLAGKPAVILSFLPGRDARDDVIMPDHCAQVGALLARMHNASQDFTQTRTNPVGLPQWQAMFDKVKAGLEPKLTDAIETILKECARDDWHDLPRGAVHADLFPDNVFFKDGGLSGVIDFYFACTSAYTYDLALTVNAWCYDSAGAIITARLKALMNAYESVRPLNTQERAAFPLLRRAAALRILMTRLYDWAFTSKDAVVVKKDPLEYAAKMQADFQWP